MGKRKSSEEERSMEIDKTTGKQEPTRSLERPGVLLHYAAIFASIVVILGGIHFARGILGPIFLSGFFTVLLIQPVNWLKRKGVKSWLALLSVIIVVSVVGLGTMTVVGAQIAQFARDIPKYRDQFTAVLENYNLDIGMFIPALESKKPQVEKLEEEAPPSVEPETGAENSSEKEEYFQRLRWRDEYEREKQKSQGRKQRADEPKTSDAAEAQLSADVPLETERFAAPVVPVAAKYEVVRADAIAIGEEDLSSDALFSNESPLTTTLLGAEDATSGLIPGDPAPMFTGAPPADEENAVDLNDPLFYEDVETSAQNAPARVLEHVSAVDASSQELFRLLSGLAKELSALFSNAFIITLFVIFMLCEAEKIPKKLLAAIGPIRFTNSHIKGVIDDIRHYMVIKTLMSMIVGTLVTILCFSVGVRYPILWGFVAFLLNYIPNIGSVVAAIPPIILAMIDGGLFIGVVTSIFFVLINCGVGYGLEPRLLGDGLDLSPAIVLIALIFFGWLLGSVGMFLSPPLAVIAKIIFQSFPETEWIAALMANKVIKPIHEDEEPVAIEA